MVDTYIHTCTHICMRHTWKTMKANTTAWSLLTYKQEKVGRDKGIPFLSLLSSQHIPRRSIIHFDRYDERKDSLSALVSVLGVFLKRVILIRIPQKDRHHPAKHCSMTVTIAHLDQTQRLRCPRPPLLQTPCPTVHLKRATGSDQHIELWFP